MQTKNSYGRTFVFDSADGIESPIEKFSGSSLNRKKYRKELAPNNDLSIEAIKQKHNEKIIKKKQETNVGPKTYSMSKRTRTKIKDKLISFSRQYENLTFLTLTFVNAVDDILAINILRKFLDNTKKRSANFHYLWVAERQTKNVIFKNNIHFHLVTNKSWDIDKYWQYWLGLQKINGVVPRDPNFKPASAFNVKKVKQHDLKRLQNYLTKYVSKNSDSFKCQVWNCSKFISALYTAHHSNETLLDNAYRWEGEKIKEYYSEYGTIHYIPLNQKTVKLYRPLDEKNKELKKNFSNYCS